VLAQPDRRLVATSDGELSVAVTVKAARDAVAALSERIGQPAV
jgi:hypothetical protein